MRFALSALAALALCANASALPRLHARQNGGSAVSNSTLSVTLRNAYKFYFDTTGAAIQLENDKVRSLLETAWTLTRRSTTSTASTSGPLDLRKSLG